MVSISSKKTKKEIFFFFFSCSLLLWSHFSASGNMPTGVGVTPLGNKGCLESSTDCWGNAVPKVSLCALHGALRDVAFFAALSIYKIEAEEVELQI